LIYSSKAGRLRLVAKAMFLHRPINFPLPFR
jgi:hypothetical protein